MGPAQANFTRGEPAVAKPPGASRRRGFTMIEILIVIGIIILLVSIGVVTFSALDQSPKLTKTMLSNLHGMLAEYEAQTAMREEPQGLYLNDSIRSPAPVKLRDVPASLLGSAADGQVGGGQQGRYRWDAVANTQILLQFLNRMPANKKLMTQIPSKQVLGTADKGTGFKVAPTNHPTAIDPPLILDGWNNPIIYVGSLGLAGVKFKVRSDNDPNPWGPPQRVTSAGVFPMNSDALDPTGLPRTRRPFFASAGPDGDFATGDDNVYSFTD